LSSGGNEDRIMFDWITSFLNSVGWIGVAILMFLENVFPPIPSELIMPLVGYNAAQGKISLIAALVAGIVGSVAGAFLWFWIGRKIGAHRLRQLAEKHGRWLTISPEELDQAFAWFDRHGGAAVLTGRLIPTVRTLISIPAGIARMPLFRFTLYSMLGTSIWTTALTLLGYWLGGQYTIVSEWLNPISTGIVILIIAWYFWRIATYNRRTSAQKDG
jgi:membrane protein DedA with SNARE-associated domain